MALLRDLHNDPMMVRRRYAEKAIDAAVVEGVVHHGDDFALAVDQTAPGAGVGALVAEEDRGTSETVTTGRSPVTGEDAPRA